MCCPRDSSKHPDSFFTWNDPNKVFKNKTMGEIQRLYVQIFFLYFCGFVIIESWKIQQKKRERPVDRYITVKTLPCIRCWNENGIEKADTFYVLFAAFEMSGKAYSPIAVICNEFRWRYLRVLNDLSHFLSA